MCGKFIKACLVPGPADVGMRRRQAMIAPQGKPWGSSSEGL
jgi:hypothetical protein